MLWIVKFICFFNSIVLRKRFNLWFFNDSSYLPLFKVIEMLSLTLSYFFVCDVWIGYLFYIGEVEIWHILQKTTFLILTAEISNLIEFPQMGSGDSKKWGTNSWGIYWIFFVELKFRWVGSGDLWGSE